MKKLALLALTLTTPAALLALTACGVKINGKSYGPGSGASGGGGSGSTASSGGGGGGAPRASTSRACLDQHLEQARRNGLSGPCWDPPGEYDTVPPVHVVPGMRQMKPTTDGDDVYWFEMPKEATQGVYGDAGCASIPTGEAYVADRVDYVPYADEDPLGPTPELPDMLGEPLTKVLAYLDGLDQPFCVSVRWDENCQREPGSVCADQRKPDARGHLGLSVAGKRPR